MDNLNIISSKIDSAWNELEDICELLYSLALPFEFYRDLSDDLMELLEGVSQLNNDIVDAVEASKIDLDYTK